MHLESPTQSRKKAVQELRSALPQTIADHELLRVIGSGAYGDVMLARNVVTGTYRALKVIWRNAFDDPKPYQREFEAIQKFEPISVKIEGFVQIHHVGRLENAFYYIMELADDAVTGREIDPARYKPRSLERKATPPLPISECISIGSHLARSLSYLHNQGLIHRDVKPSNIIFVNGKPKLADIGLVTQIEQADSLVGTAGFMAPEGPIQPESDVFSLGKVLYEISTGKDRQTFPLLADQTALEHFGVDDHLLYLELNQIILKACNPRPEGRYRTASAMLAELELLQAGRSIKRLRQAEKRLKFAGVAFVTALLLGAGAFLAKTIHDREIIFNQRRLAHLNSRGTDRMWRGDYASALPFFLAAAREDHENLKNHQLRIGAVVAHGVRKVRSWNGGTDASFSADGRWLLQHVEGELQVCDALTGEVQESFRIKGKPVTPRLNADNRLIGYAEGTTVRVIDRESKSSRMLPLPSDVLTFAFHPERDELAAGLTNGFALVNTHSGETKTCATDFQVGGLVYEPGGKRILVIGNDDWAQVWDGDSRQALSPKFRHYMAYAGLFPPFHTNRVLTAGYEGAAYWEIASGEVINKTLEHEYGAHCLAFSPDFQWLASGGLDRTVRFSDARTLRPVSRNHVLYHPDRVISLAFVDDSTLVAHCDDGSNHIWDLRPPLPKIEKLNWKPLPERCVDAKAGMGATGHANTVIVTSGGKTNGVIRLKDQVSAVALHPKGKYIAVGTQDKEFNHHSALLYEPRNFTTPRHRLKHLDGITHIAFSPSGRKVATCSEDHTAILWDVETGRQLEYPLRHGWQVQWAAFNADETWLATASWDGTVIIWDTETCEPLTPPLNFGTHLVWVKFAEDEHSIIAGNEKHKELFKMDLPFASLPLDQYENALPPPLSLAIKSGRF